MEMRARWADSWADVKYCSPRCRRTKLNRTDQALESTILDLLAQRGRKGRVSPDEVTLIVSSGVQEAADLLRERCRMAARRLAAQGRVELIQKGRPADPSTARGPFELRLR